MQSSAHFATLDGVRTIGSLLMLLLGVWNLSAQEQENKLTDRLLKPNTSLKNQAEGKQFVTATAVPTDKHVSTPAFSLREQSPPKSFPRQRTFMSKEIPAARFREGDSVADVASRPRPIRADRTVSAPTVQVQVAPESGAAISSREFADNRPFLAEGKSQKALRTKNKPLTIEQVRELLNKSK